MKYILTTLLILLVIISGIVYSSEQVLINTSFTSENNVIHKPVDDFTYDIIKELTSAPYMGRLPGTYGNTKAVEFLIDKFKEVGLKPPSKYPDYKQSFNQVLLDVVSPAVLITSRKTGEVTGEYNNLSDYIGLTLWPNSKVSGDAKGELYYVHSISQLKRSNNAIKNKILLVDKEIVYSLQHDIRQADGVVKKLLSLGNHIKGALINFDNKRDGYFHVSKQMGRYFRGGSKYNNKDGQILMYCSNKAFKFLKEAADRKDYAYLKMDYKVKSCVSSNIIGVIKGSNTRSNKHLIIGAHLDHIGDNKDETYNPGALDNASGVAAILEIARTLINKGTQPEYDIYVIAFNGEEEYFAGSNYYVSHPLKPLDYCKMLNYDMVGATESEYLEVCYANARYIKMSENIVNIAEKKDINARTNYVLSSDHVTFTVCGVPSVMFKHLQKVQRHHTMQDSLELTMDMNIHQQAVVVSVEYIEANYYK